MLPTIVRKRNYVSPSILDDFFNANYFPGFYNSGATRVKSSNSSINVKEDEKEFLIEVVAPGIEKDELKITIEEGVLGISYEHDKKKDENNEGYLRKEFTTASFKRSFKLPDEVEVDKISAKHKNGVLYIHLPKSEVKVTPAKEIKIG